VIGPARALVGGNQEVGRDAFLRQLDGLVFGDSAASGIRRGRHFYHGELDFTLTYPQGWQLVNRADVLIGHTPDEQAFIAMTLEPADKALAPAEYLRQRVGNQRLVAGEELRLGTLRGYTAILQGQAARRVAVIYRGDSAYLFVAAIKGRASLESEDERFLEVIRSYRPLKATERKLAEPVRLHLVRAKAGQGMASLARNSPLPSDGEAQLRLLNGLYPAGEPRAGQWLKTLR
jgi:predicted Zn-dependent protease